LPVGLPPSGFTVASALGSGVAERRLGARDLARPHRGVRVLASAEVSFSERCRLLAMALPSHTFFSGVTAATLFGMPLPLRYAAARVPPLEVSVADPARGIRRQGVHGRRLQIAATDVGSWRGVRVTSPERTWCDLAPVLTLGQLVAAGDFLIFHERAMVTRAALAAAVAAHPGRRWRGALKRALELLDDHSESPKESELRVIVVTHALPTPLANVEILDEQGRFVARVDLLFEDYRETLEYLGDGHRTDVRQWRRDQTRRAEVESLGYHQTDVVADDLENVNVLVRRIERNLRRRGWTGRATYDP
jgi:hypothetical protein